MFSLAENIYTLATNVILSRCVDWKRLEALKVMTAQNKIRKTSQQKLDNCLISEAKSDTHALDISGVASSVADYAIALHREASSRRRAHRARIAAIAADIDDQRTAA